MLRLRRRRSWDRVVVGDTQFCEQCHRQPPRMTDDTNGWDDFDQLCLPHYTALMGEGALGGHVAYWRSDAE